MRRWLVVAPLVLAACSETTGVGGRLLVDTPTGLRYVVEPSGTPGEPAGVLLVWDFDDDPDLQVWNVYSRNGTSGAFDLRGTTTSNSFDDRGEPDLQYYVTAIDLDNNETDPSNLITVDERLTLDRPNTLGSVSLDGAVALTWSDNPFTGDPDGFLNYRVYSTGFDLDGGECDAEWQLEGTTVAPEFVVGALGNGVPRCFAVSAISVEGFESLWSPLRNDTPRPDARNVVVFASQADAARSGFRFWEDVNGDGRVQSNELGRILAASSTAADFTVERDASNALFITPKRSGTEVALYGSTPVDDLTSIDIAPENGYSTAPVEALPGWGYVFRMVANDPFDRFGGLRVTHVGRDFLILDWSYQTDPGNPELRVGGGMRAGGGGVVVVSR